MRVSSTDTADTVDYRAKGRSRLSNGATLLPGADGRSTWSRRFRDLIELFSNDLGGDAVASEAQRSLIRRAATLSVQLEQLEVQFATTGGVDAASLDVYLRSVGHLHRILGSLGLDKKPNAGAPEHSDPTTDSIIRALKTGASR